MSKIKWENSLQHIGTVKSGIYVTIKFKALEPIPEIRRLSASCGCTKPSYDEKENLITVKFNTGKIPKHLVPQGYYETSKSVLIHYKDGEKDRLTFTAKIVM